MARFIDILTSCVSRAAENISLIAFLALFPMFFFYHLAAAAGVLPYVFGSLWSSWNGIAAFLFVVLLAVTQKAFSVWDIAVLVLIAIFAGYALYHYFFGLTWQQSLAPALESIKLILGILSLYGIGRFWKRPDKTQKWLLLSSWAGIVLASLLLMNIENGAFVASDRFRNPNAATYQWFAQAFAFTSLACIAFAPSPRLLPIVVGISPVVLFVLSSRSDLISLSIVVFAWVALCVLIQPKKLSSVALALAVFSLAGTTLAVSSFSRATLPGPQKTEAKSAASTAVRNRQLELKDIAQSDSYKERAELLKYGVNDIISSPIVGKYAGQLQRGGFGGYIHNALSAWQNFGLIAFILYLTLALSALLIAARQVLLRNANSEWHFAFYVSLFTFLSVVAAKSVYWPLPALAWGLVAGLSIRKSQKVAFVSSEPGHKSNYQF
ncbi:MAG: hypothetical protein Q7T86_17635 [Hyphomicrobiaceae bacterium]|nr:hypothetical protein [Hyphomicrobiaceae bacterium]